MGMTHRDARSLGALLNGVLGLVLLFVVYLGQPANVTFDGHVPGGPVAAGTALLHRFDCWTAANPRPGVIPGGVLFDRGTRVVHSGSDAVTGRFLNHLDSSRLAAFCVR